MKVSKLKIGMLLLPIEEYSAVILQDAYSLSADHPTNELQCYHSKFIDVILGLSSGTRPVSRQLVHGPIVYLGKRKVMLRKNTQRRLKNRFRANTKSLTIHELLVNGEVALAIGREFRNLRPVEPYTT